MVINSKKEAINQWRLKNPDNVRYINYRSSAKKYLNENATLDEIKQLQNYINLRRILLKNPKYVRQHQVFYKDNSKSKNSYYFRIIPGITDTFFKN